MPTDKFYLGVSYAGTFVVQLIWLVSILACDALGLTHQVYVCGITELVSCSSITNDFF